MKKVKIALLGLGNVGQGVWKILTENKREIMINCGYGIEVSKVLVRYMAKQRKVDIPTELLTTDPEEIFGDDSIKIVVELIGGAEPAKGYMLRAMKCKNMW